MSVAISPVREAMETEEQFVRSILAGAAFLHERRRPSFSAAPKMDNAQVEKKLQEWASAAYRGDQETFRHRLKWDGLDESTVGDLVRGVSFTGEEMPLWTKFILGGLEEAKSISGIEGVANYPFLHPEHPIAFEELLGLFVCHAGAVVADDGLLSAMSATAFLDLQRYLLSVLSDFCWNTFYLEFDIFRSLRKSVRGTEQSPGSRILYDAFTSKMAANGLWDLFLRYPVLARYVGEACQNWTEAVRELVQHFQQDRGELEQKLFGGTECGQIVRIGSGLSDRHKKGRTVFYLQFEEGQRCMYKPRSLAPELFVQHLIEWIESHDPDGLHLRMPIHLDHGSYGWAEFMEPAPCQSEEQVKKYYARSGMLLAVFYALGSSDMHGENIFACGEFPIPVDLETALGADLLSGVTAETIAGRIAMRELWDRSVLRVGMLPRWLGDSDASQDWQSGFGPGAADVKIPVSVATDINTDSMRPGPQQWHSPTLPATVRVADKVMRPSHYIDETCAGLARMYRLLLDHREELLGAGGPLDSIKDLKVRLVYRNTAAYASLARDLKRPVLLRDGIDASIRCDVLFQVSVQSPVRPHMWELHQGEIESILGGDIPLVALPCSNREFHVWPDFVVQGGSTMTAEEAVRDRLASLSPRDLELQVGYARFSFTTGKGDSAQYHDHFVSQNEPSSGSHEEEISEAEALEESEQIAASMLRSAIWSADRKTVTWITQYLDVEAGVLRIRPMNIRLYDGLAGVGILFAALAAKTRKDQHYSTLEAILRFLREARWDGANQLWIGGGLGLASSFYACHRIAQWTQSELASEIGADILSMLTKDRISADEDFDVLGGVAGCILALLAVNQPESREQRLELAQVCADHLIKNQRQGVDGRVGWKTEGSVVGLGFAHGNSGIAYALMRLYEETGNEVYKQHFMQAVESENAVLLDMFRQKTAAMSMFSTWCNGLPGIGIARLLMKNQLDQWERHAEIVHRAVEIVESGMLYPPDHLCCGTLGRVELLLTSSEVQKDEFDACLARQTCRAMVLRARAKGGYALQSSGFAAPGFHQGIAGIGYSLLRVVEPSTYPSILALA